MKEKFKIWGDKNFLTNGFFSSFFLINKFSENSVFKLFGFGIFIPHPFDIHHTEKI